MSDVIVGDSGVNGHSTKYQLGKVVIGVAAGFLAKVYAEKGYEKLIASIKEHRSKNELPTEQI